MTDPALVRPYLDQDFLGLAELIDAVTAPERVMTLAGLRAFLTVPGYHPETDLFVVPAAGGVLLGARDVRVTARGDEVTPIFESWGDVLPAARGGDVPIALLRAALARARRLLSERGRRRAIVQARCAADDAATQAAFAAVGLRHARDLVSMLRRDLTDLDEPRWPPGIGLRPYRPGEDDAAWVAAFNEAFANHWGGFMGLSPDRWRHTLDQPAFKPEISLVACNGPEIAGFCHCWIDDELNDLAGRRVGMIRYVGVRPRWRRGGLGTALTLAGLRTLRAAGMTAVALGVDAENVTGARRLYERHGFVVVGREVMYRRELTPRSDESRFGDA